MNFSKDSSSEKHTVQSHRVERCSLFHSSFRPNYGILLTQLQWLTGLIKKAGNLFVTVDSAIEFGHFTVCINKHRETLHVLQTWQNKFDWNPFIGTYNCPEQIIHQSGCIRAARPGFNSRQERHVFLHHQDQTLSELLSILYTKTNSSFRRSKVAVTWR
jgi:hypothetical protein